MARLLLDHCSSLSLMRATICLCFGQNEISVVPELPDRPLQRITASRPIEHLDRVALGG
jgi:hypothetical protein